MASDILVFPRRTTTAPTRASRRWAAIELTLLIGLLFSAIWSTDPVWRLVLAGAACGISFRCLLAYGRLPRWKTGLGQLRMDQTDRLILTTTIMLAILSATIAYLLDCWTPNWSGMLRRSAHEWIFVKIPTVVFQQLLFQLVVVPLLIYLVVGRVTAIVLSAGLFSVLHLPNPLLMLLTLVIGLIWFAAVVDRPRLTIVTLSHLILAVVIASVADDYVLDMRVGQACFQKWPDKLRASEDGRELLIYPRLLTGQLDQVSQTGDQVRFRGQVFDPARAQAPEQIHLVFGDFDPELADRWVPRQIMTAAPEDDQGRFEVLVSATRISGSSEIRLFAQHRLGWTYPLNGSVRIDVAPRDVSGETVCLHPQQFRGNIGHLRKRQSGTDFIGWGFDLDARQPLESLLVLHAGQLQPVAISPRRRPEIARFYGDPRLLNCGLEARTLFQFPSELPVVYVRNSSGQLERLPMELARPPAQRLTQRSAERR